MNELIAAYGILQLQQIDKIIAQRKEKAETYRNLLKELKGIKAFEEQKDMRYNYSYFPVLITNEFHKTRDEVYEDLKKENIFARRYFYPLISNFPAYKLAYGKKRKFTHSK